MGLPIQNYNNWTYSPQMIKKLEETALDELSLEKINIANEKIRDKAHYFTMYKPIIEPLFKMRFLLNFTAKEMADVYGLNIRTMERWLERFGWKFTRQESQQLAAKKSRDYTSIRLKGKETMLKRHDSNNVFGSKVEEFVRQTLNIKLPQALRNCQVIIGLNNVSVLEMEIDIPIIIFKDAEVYKYAIEINGTFNHDINKLNKREIKKANLINESDFKLINVYTKSYFNDENKLVYKEIEHKILEIEKMLINEVLNGVNIEKVVNI